MGILIVIDQGKLHKVDNDPKFTNFWELANFPKPTEPQLNRTVDFISDRSFLTHTNPESWQNFRSIGVVHVYTASL